MAANVSIDLQSILYHAVGKIAVFKSLMLVISLLAGVGKLMQAAGCESQV